VSALDNGTSVVLRGAEGDTEEFKAAGTGFTNPPGEDGVLSRNADRTLSFQDTDGTTLSFAANGTLSSATTASDDAKPAALNYTWSTSDAKSPPRLTAITDPVSGRQASFGYNTFDGGCTTISPPDGRTDIGRGPTNSLCAVFYTTTPPGGIFEDELFYDSSGQLRAIYEMGGALGDEHTEFGYTNGLLTAIKSPQAYDAGRNDAGASTTIAYAGNRVTSVKLPTATSTDAASEHRYATGLTGATVNEVDGATTPLVLTATSDGAGRVTDQSDGAGIHSKTFWNADDQVAATIDGAGLETATAYDYAKRPVNTYGPAPSSCFATSAPYLPNGSCAVPTSTTNYDEGISGLAAAYWPNESFAGSPALHATGVNSVGTLDAFWSGAPTTNPTSGQAIVLTNPNNGATVVDHWSARFTGEIKFDTAGDHFVSAYVDDGVRVFVDDKPVSESWGISGLMTSARRWVKRTTSAHSARTRASSMLPPAASTRFRAEQARNSCRTA
jgi:hypothetical protein